VIFNFALVTSDQTLGVLELSVASEDDQLPSHLEKLKEYAASHHLSSTIEVKTNAELRRALNPTPRHRIIFSDVSRESKNSILSKIDSLHQSHLRMIGARRLGQIVAIDVESDMSQQSLLDTLYEGTADQYIRVLSGGADLRRPRPFIFIGQPPQSLVQELHKRGALICVVGSAEIMDNTVLLTGHDGERFLELVQARRLDASESIVVHLDTNQSIPLWVPSNYVGFSTSATPAATFVLDRTEHILQLASVAPPKPHASSQGNGFVNLREASRFLEKSEGDVAVICTETVAACVTPSSDGPAGYVLTTVSKIHGQRLLARSLAAIAEFTPVKSVSGRLLSSSQHNTHSPTPDASSLLPLDSFEVHIQLEMDCNADVLFGLRQKLKQIADELKGDAALQPNNLSRIFKRLAVFDMDSTLVQQECIDEMAEVAGVGEEVKQITLRAMNGELDFESALRARVALLTGLQADELFQHICRNLEYTPGASFMAATLQRLGLTLAVVSGGFTSVVSAVKDFLKLHHAYANELEITDSKLTGGLAPGSPIVDSKSKLFHLKRLAETNQLPLEQSIAVGDGANVRLTSHQPLLLCV
jgi:phosphoserine phosphatase SerB